MALKRTRLLCRLDEVQWSDSCIYGKGDPIPTVVPGSRWRIQLSMKPNELELQGKAFPRASMSAVDRLAYEIVGRVRRRLGWDHGTALLLDAGFPIVARFAKTKPPPRNVTRGATVRVSGPIDIVLYRAFWELPLLAPVWVRIVRVSGDPDRDWHMMLELEILRRARTIAV